MTFDVACVGIAVYDLVFEVESLPIVAGKQFARDLSQLTGGPAAVAALTVTRLGGSASFAGRLGTDRWAEQIISDLVSAGVDVSHTRRVEGARTPVSAVMLTPSGERAIVNHTDPSLFEPDPAPEPDARVILVDSRWSAGARRAIEAAGTDTVATVLDLDRTDDPRALRPVVEVVTHIVASRSGIVDVAGTDDVDAALAILASEGAWVAVTDGAAPIRWRRGDVAGTVPTVKVDTVHTLGAGDVFHGAFALALAEGRPEVEALAFAAAAAAHRCRVKGPAGIPRRADIIDLWEEATRWR